MAIAGDIIRRKALNLLVERAEVKDEDSGDEKASGAGTVTADEQPGGQASEEPGQKVENESPD
jgi:hypothetical protein